jgi:tetratricopeptide (TPR) repeat protein
LDQLNKALELEPSDSSVHLLLGLTYQELGQLEKAENSLNHAYEIDPESFEIKQSYGILLSVIQKNQEAINILSPLLESNPKNSPICRALASSLKREQKVEEAIRILKTNLEQCKDQEVVLDLAELFKINNQYDQAERMLEDYLQKESSLKVLAYLGHLYFDQKKYEKAIFSFERAISLKENIETAWVGLTRVHIAQGNLGTALEVAENGITKIPKNRHLFQLKGDIFFLQKKNDEALQAYGHAIEVFKLTRGSFDIGVLLYYRDRKVLSYIGANKALELIEIDINTTGVFPPLVSLKARILIDQKKYKKAVKFIESLDLLKYEDLLRMSYYQGLIGINEYDKAFDLLQKEFNSQDFEKQNAFLDDIENLAIELFSNGKIGESRNIFEQVLQLVPSRNNSLNNLAFIQISQHDWENSLNLLKKAQDNDYSSMDILLTNRGYVYLCMGDCKLAIETLQEALLLPDNINSKEHFAYLHVAYSQGGQLIFNEGDDFPERLILKKLAINANLATAYYMNGEVDKALFYANEAVNCDLEDSIGFRISGNLHASEGHYEIAESFFKKALGLKKAKNEVKIIKEECSRLANQING